MICFAFITYLEFLLIHTDNTFLDKKIASSELKTWYLNHTCRLNNVTRNMGKRKQNIWQEDGLISDGQLEK